MTLRIVETSMGSALHPEDMDRETPLVLHFFAKEALAQHMPKATDEDYKYFAMFYTWMICFAFANRNKDRAIILGQRKRIDPRDYCKIWADHWAESYAMRGGKEHREIFPVPDEFVAAYSDWLSVGDTKSIQH